MIKVKILVRENTRLAKTLQESLKWPQMRLDNNSKYCIFGCLLSCLRACLLPSLLDCLPVHLLAYILTCLSSHLFVNVFFLTFFDFVRVC